MPKVCLCGSLSQYTYGSSLTVCMYVTYINYSKRDRNTDQAINTANNNLSLFVHFTHCVAIKYYTQFCFFRKRFFCFRIHEKLHTRKIQTKCKRDDTHTHTWKKKVAVLSFSKRIRDKRERIKKECESQFFVCWSYIYISRSSCVYFIMHIEMRIQERYERVVNCVCFALCETECKQELNAVWNDHEKKKIGNI